MSTPSSPASIAALSTPQVMRPLPAAPSPAIATRGSPGASARAPRRSRPCGSRPPSRPGSRARPGRRPGTARGRPRGTPTGSTRRLRSRASRSRNRAGRRKGNSSSSGASTCRKRTSWRRCLRCRSAAVQRVERLESVGEDDDQPAPARPLGQGVQEAAQGGLAAGLRLFQRLAEDREMAGGRPGRDQAPGLAVGGDQPDGVALADHQVGQRRREPPRVLELRARPPRVAHAPRRVDDEVRLEVRLFLIFLDVVAVALAERPPVDVADLVPRPVLAVLGELDREALERAPVHPRHHPLDHQPRHQLEPAEARQRRGVDRAAVDESIFHRHGPRPCPHLVAPHRRRPRRGEQATP